MRVFWIFGFLLIQGCASYGWADRDRAGGDLMVATVDVAPHLGIDAGLLTRQLVEELGNAGVAATWGGGANALKCRLDAWDQLAFGSTLTVRAELACELDDYRVSRTGRSQATLSDANDVAGFVPTREQAAMQAVQAIAPPIASHRDHHGS